MIKGLLQLLLFQGLGELISKFVLSGIPGPVLGLVCLFVYLVIRGQVSSELATVGQSFAQHLGILFVPAAVGVVLFIPQLKAHGLVIVTILLISVSLTLLVTAVVLRLMTRSPIARATPQSQGRHYGTKERPHHE